MLDMQKRRPVAISNRIVRMASQNSSHVLPIEKNRIDINDHPTHSKIFHIRRSDLDLNEHVNNVRYIKWALEALPKNQTVKEIDIGFRAECRYGEQIKSGVVHGKHAINKHMLRRRNDQKPVAIAQSQC